MIDPSQQSAIRVILVDAVGLFRASLGRFLASAGLQVVGECGTTDEAVELLRHSPADLVLLDLDSSLHADSAVASAHQAGYDGKFLAMAGALDIHKLAIALKTGVLGIFLKSEPPEQLLQAIRVVARGEVWIDRKVIQTMASELIERARHRDARPPALDERERRVLHGIVGGNSNKTIGEEMGLSESSVKNIVQRLFYKSGVKTRSQLVRMALEGSFGTRDFRLSGGPNGRTEHPKTSAKAPITHQSLD